MSFVRSRLFFDRRSISVEMSTALSSCTKRSSSIFCSSSAIGCSKSRKLVFTLRMIAANTIPKMGHRLSKIVTRTGDDGTTGLGDGARVPKDSPRVAALGDLDELNSALGCVLAQRVPTPVRGALLAAQNDLFDLGGEISIPGRVALQPLHVEGLDRCVEALNSGLPPLKEFVLPGGDRAAAACHLARAICRRA